MMVCCHQVYKHTYKQITLFYKIQSCWEQSINVQDMYPNCGELGKYCLKLINFNII